MLNWTALVYCSGYNIFIAFVKKKKELIGVENIWKYITDHLALLKNEGVNSFL